MSKSFNVDISSFNNTNDMDTIYAGITPKAKTIETPKDTNTKNNNTNKNHKNNDNNNKSGIIDHTKTKDAKGRVNKKNNYAITIKIDEDLKDYLSKIEWVKMLSDRVSTNKNQFINDLIRTDMIKRLNLREDATYEEMQKAWAKYKKANNI